MMQPFGYPPVQTLFTSLSLLGIYMFFLNEETKSLQFASLNLIVLPQLISLLLLSQEFTSQTLYFVSSSVPTSGFLIFTAMIIYLSEFHLTKGVHLFFAFALQFGVLLFFLFAFITQKFEYLGWSHEIVGVGMSYYTFLGFTLVHAMCVRRYIRLVSLEILNFHYRPWLAVCVFAALAVVNFSLLLLEGGKHLYLAIGTNIFFLFLGLCLLVAPFVRSRDRIITVCAWSGLVKSGDGKWLSVPDLAEELGVSISHGIAPDEKEKIINPAVKI